MYLFQLLNIELDELSLKVRELTDGVLNLEIGKKDDNVLEGAHRKLLKLYQTIEKENPQSNFRYELLNIVLNSAVRCGDFLNLSTLFYKVNKEIEVEPDKFLGKFLSSYLESRSLYNFYDNNIIQSIKDIESTLNNPTISLVTQERVFFYSVSILIGGYLPLQARNLIIDFKKKLPDLKLNPLLLFFEIVTAVENHEESALIIELAKKMREIFSEDEHTKNIFKAVDEILLFTEKQKFEPLNFIPLFPENWEQTFMINFWIKAKLQNKFYYNMICDNWIQCRKVF